MSIFKNIPPQITRLALVAVVLVALFLVARYLLTPASFGKYGHYRADAIAEVEALPLKYAGKGACEACHPEVEKLKNSSVHKDLACETCHGPTKGHTENPMSVKPVKPKGRDFCGLCHSKNAARPGKAIHQVDLETHNAGMDCNLCHKGHDPLKGIR